MAFRTMLHPTFLSPYPSYRPSGVEWLEDVPGHWELPSVKQCYEVQLGKMLQPTRQSEEDREVPYLKALHVQWFAVNQGPPQRCGPIQEMLRNSALERGTY